VDYQQVRAEKVSDDRDGPNGDLTNRKSESLLALDARSSMFFGPSTGRVVSGKKNGRGDWI
jgi:hypothetical protein